MQSAVVNQLLDALPSREGRRIVAACEVVELTLAEVIHVPGEQVRYAHFPTRGFISLLVGVTGPGSLEVGLVGREGMFGVALALGMDTSPVRAVVQGAGLSLRMEAVSFRDELKRSSALQHELHRYAFFHITQLAQAAACAKFHMIEARLARWLLLTEDRAHAKHFYVTHEGLAAMLGVRRVGVTTAASAMQARGLIRYSRGLVTVLSRRGLKAVACECYALERESYARTFGAPAL